jgi:hypothetical protein
MTVNELIHENRRSWDVEALHENLVQADIEAVLPIPLGRPTEDFWAWVAEKHGQYSVRSAYKLLACRDAQNRDNRGNHSSTSFANDDPLWKVHWKLSVPPKVRVFWWWVVNDFIPCRANLHHRHIEQLSTCEVCGAKSESTFHALTECTFAKIFWQQVKDIT